MLRYSIKASVASLAFALAACGGGGGETAVPSTGGGGGGGGSGGGTPPPSSAGLQAHLAACPVEFKINEAIPCMAGLYEGKSTVDGAPCAFSYSADTGVAVYQTGSSALRADLSLYSAAVYEKKLDSNSAGFSISWAVGIGSGNGMHLYYQHVDAPGSANGLLVKPDATAMPACLIERAPKPPAVGGATDNLLGRNWQSPQLLNGSTGALGYFSDQAAFDAGMADDGRAFITYRQPDAAGRMAVHVVDGQPGAAGSAPAWAVPVVLDADAPLLTGNFRPRIAVSGTGHAVVSWMTERPCEADAYELTPAGKTCRYFYASRRLAGEAVWEPAKRVHASMPSKALDHYARINARGDVLLAFPGYYWFISSFDLTSMVALRRADEANYRAVRLAGFDDDYYVASAQPFADAIGAVLDDDSNLFVAGSTAAFFGSIGHVATPLSAVGADLRSQAADNRGVRPYDLKTSGRGFAAYTWSDGSNSPSRPTRLTVYSSFTNAWLAPYDITAYTLWGDNALVGTDAADGEFLLYSGCKLTAWRAGTWGATRDLPAYCGRDQTGGIYAFNRKGDYLGLNWAGQAGQWGYYSYAQNKMLKGAPGTGAAVAGDYALGTPSNLFGAAPTQLLLAPNGLALAVTSNTYTTLPSAANPAGVNGGSAHKLWATYLK